MLLEKLHLENIRSYKKSTIKFKEGSTLICGDIGSGKSTILIALEFCLFGTIKGSLESTSLLRRGEKNGTIELEFKIEDNKIKIKRFLEKTKNSVKQLPAHLVINEKKEILTPVEIQSKIESIINHPKTSKNLLFRYSTYTPQEDMKRILFENEETRIKTIKKIFNVDKYSTIKDNLSRYLKELRTKIKIKEERLKDYELVNIKIKEKKELLKQIQEELNSITQEYKIKEEFSNKEEKKIEELDFKEKEINKIKNESENILENITKNKEQILENKNEIEKNKEELRKIEEEIKNIKIEDINSNEEEIQKENISLNKIINETQNKIQINLIEVKNLEQKIEETKNNIQNNEKNIETITDINKKIDNINEKIELEEKFKTKLEITLQNIENKKKEITQIKTKIDLLKKSKEDILNLDNCPTCKQKVCKEHKDNFNNDANKKIELLEKEYQEISKNTKEEELKISFLKNKLDEILTNKETKKHLLKKIEELKEIKILTNKQKINLEENISLHINKKDELKKLREINLDEKNKLLEENNELLKKIQKNKENKIKKENLILHFEKIINNNEKLEEKNNNLEKNNKNYPEIENKLNVIKKELLETQNILRKTKENYKITKEKLTNILTKKITKEKEIEYTKREIEELKIREEEKNKISKNIYNIKNQTTWLNNNFINLIEKIEKQVFFQIHERFNSRFQEWFNIIIEDEEITSKIDENFTPQITLQGFDANITTLSGGEKTSVALAYRLALNKIINELVSSIKTQDLLILDEPTDGFSSQQLDKMRDILEKINSKQMILVSHENKIESYVQNIIRLQKQNQQTTIIEE